MKVKLAVMLAALVYGHSAFSMYYKVEIQNVTTSAYFTPFLIATHSTSLNLFTLGEAASANLQAMAEGGNISGLAQEVADAGGKTVLNPAGGLLAPGQKTSANLGFVGYSNTRLSIAAMLVPSNDAFIGLRSLKLPVVPGVYNYELNVYDSGTEANDEIRGSGAVGVPGMAVPPPISHEVGVGGTGLPNVAPEGFVSVHRGFAGDYDLNGGLSDLDAANSHWPTKAARLKITVSYY